MNKERENNQDLREYVLNNLISSAWMVLAQEERISAARKPEGLRPREDIESICKAIATTWWDEYFMLCVANKMFSYLDRAKKCGFVDFGDGGDFVRCKELVKEVRDMREHDMDYVRGNGHSKEKFFGEFPVGVNRRKVKLSALVSYGDDFGGRISYKEIAKAAQDVLSWFREHEDKESSFAVRMFGSKI